MPSITEKASTALKILQISAGNKKGKKLQYPYLSLQKYIMCCLLKIFFSMLSVPFYHYNFLLKDQCLFNPFFNQVILLKALQLKCFFLK